MLSCQLGSWIFIGGKARRNLANEILLTVQGGPRKITSDVVALYFNGTVEGRRRKGGR